MNIQEQNVPQSYRDLFATIPEKSNFFYKSIEGNSIDKLPSVEVLKTAFAFGFSDGGILFFHPENHSVWVIYDDLYTQLVADTFDEFLEKATFQRQWNFK